MRTKLTLLVIFFLVLTFSFNLVAQDTNDEFRATWTITWNYGMPGASVATQKARIREILDNHKKANMNAVLWQVRQSGTAYYNSSYEPWGYYVGNSYPGFDPLAYAVKEAHKRGMEIHAWFNTFSTASTVAGTPAAEHPEWVCRDGNGNPMNSNYALSPGLEAVRDYTLQVAMEIVRNYDIDGLHLDYIRWNEYSNTQQSQAFAKQVRDDRLLDGMITQEQIQELQQTQDVNRYLYDINHPYSTTPPDGFDSWEDWWRWSVTTFVHNLHDSIQAVKPWVRLSVAALGKYNWSSWQGYGSVFQDAALWFNEGYIDQLTPMHYHWTSGSAFYAMLTGTDAESWQPNIQQGIDDGRLFTVGPPSYILLDNDIWGRHPGIVNSCREVPWTDGFQFFSYGSWESYNYWDTAGATFFARKTKIRASGLIDNVPPDPPSLSMQKMDSLHYALNVTPSTSLGENNWYAVYRSEENSIDVDSDPIVSVQFGDSTFAVIDSFSGNQDYNDSYFYGVTQLDRYWNESAPSNIEMSDPIPSSAPTITEMNLAVGDTIPVNQSVQVTFSKTMDTTSVNSAISFEPNISSLTINWDSDRKTVQIIPDGHFAYGTNYTFTIAASALDINGRQLDGNSDGIEGDEYSLEFRTLEVDNEGPVLTYSFPSETQTADSFKVDNVLTFYFNELLDPGSVSDASVHIYQDGQPLDIGYNLTSVNERSILNIQPLTPFEMSTSYSVNLSGDITDTLGNLMGTPVSRSFITHGYRYNDLTFIDAQFSPADWWDPEGSGTTYGTVGQDTYFDISTEAYLPNAPTRQRSSGLLHYHWDTGADRYLLREYLSGGAPRDVIFNNSYRLQVYLFGDGSYTKFRFALDDGIDANQSDHEVSKWISINWIGWRMVEWDLSDPNSFGDWIGDHSFQHPNQLRFDSFQLTYDPGVSDVSGLIYLDDLRLVHQTTEPSAISDDNVGVPKDFVLHQNYPNPFNPVTNIRFTLPKRVYVKLIVYDISGRVVKILKKGYLQAGGYTVSFDGSKLSSGVYLYRLQYGTRQITRRMLLIQ